MDVDRHDLPLLEGAKEEDTIKKGKPIVVLLVGPPGSGKSTFCDRVMSSSSRPWARICQDTINNGKAGTKTQCIKSAADALKKGKSVFIDRCNIDKEQRSEFVKLGNFEIDVHAVVLDLPAQLCISRSVKRTGHEGHLQGGRAAAVVNKMLQKKELPELSEGFSRIMFCHIENDVQAAIDTYCELGPLDIFPHGSFGAKKPGAKVQLGIMKFLKKVDASSNVKSNIGSIDSSCPGNDASDKRSDNVRPFTGTASKEVKGDEELIEGSICNNGDNSHTLAFPSISTADFQFNIEKASDIIVEKVAEFVNKLGNARLVLVDLSHGSKILSMVKAKAAQRNIDSKRFFTFVGNITQLYSQGGLHCNVIANAANWRLKPGGGGVNAAIYSAAGPALEAATKEQAVSLLPGQAVVVPLPSNSPLYDREGVSHIIHVLGPNMNPQRPNYLNGDYAIGCKVLGDAYTSLFNGFVSILQNQGKLSTRSSKNIALEQSSQNTGHITSINLLTNSDQKIKRHDDCISERSKKCKGPCNESGVGNTVSDSTYGKASGDDHKIDGSTSKSWNSWAQALFHIAMHPERHKGELLEISDDVVVLNDLYPKAQKHLLVLARYPGLNGLADVNQEHIQLLMTMHETGLKRAIRFLQDDSSMIFRLGYHSTPSMRQLHLHVISQDFNSDHLKNKKHWNSFNSAFFRDSVDVIEEVKNHGEANIKDGKSHLSMELRCHRCRSAHPNIPRLKSHISNCRAPFPPSLLENNRLVLSQDSYSSDS